MIVRTLILAAMLVACAAPAGQPTSQSGATPTLPAGGGPASPTGGGSAPTTAPGNGSPGETLIVVELDGRSITLPNVALCLITDDRVEISASAAGGLGGVTVSWRSDRPAAETMINYLDLGQALNLVAGPDVSSASPPQVTVSGDTIEVLAQLHDPSLRRPSQTMRLVARCPAGRIDDPTPEPEPVRAGRASVSIEGTTHEFDQGEQCDVRDGIVSVVLTDGRGNDFNVIVMGQAGFTTINVDGEQWVAGLSGEPIQPSVRGATATWSGPASETYSSREAVIELMVTCSG